MKRSFKIKNLGRLFIVLIGGAILVILCMFCKIISSLDNEFKEQMKKEILEELIKNDKS